MIKLLQITFLSLLLQLGYGQAKKVVLIEEGTGTWCQWCPRGDVYAQELQKQYPDQFAFVAIHEGDPMEYESYFNASGLTGLPTGNVDRSFQTDLDPFNSLQSDMEAQLSMEPIVELQTVFLWDDTSREVQVLLYGTFEKDLSGDYRYAAIVIEDGVTGPAPQYDQSNSYSGGDFGPMGGYEDLPSPVTASVMVYNHVARHLMGGYNGQAGSLPSNIVEGTQYTHEFDYILPAEYNEDYIRVIGMVINAETGQVVNTHVSKYLVSSNGIPFFHSEPRTNAFIGAQYQYDIVTHDPDHDALTISAVGPLPDGLELIDNGGGFAQLLGMPTTAGNYNITLKLEDGNWEIFQEFELVVSTTETDWLQVGAEGFGAEDVYAVDIVINAVGKIYVMGTNGGQRAEVYEYDNGDWTLLGDPILLDPFHVDIAIGLDGLPVVLSDAFSFQYHDGSWKLIGSQITSGGFLYPEIIMDGTGSLNAVYFSPPESSKFLQSDGVSWTELSDFTDGIGVWPKFNLDQDRNPILIYGTDGSNIAYSEVSRLNGTDWEQLGGYIEPNSQTYFDHDVAVSSDGRIFAALTIGVGVQQLNIYEYVAGEWMMLAENLAGAATEACNLKADNEGNLFVAYRDEGNGGRTTVKKYNGVEWENLGIEGFTNIASKQALAIDSNGIPYVAYSDEANAGKLNVKRFDKIDVAVEDAIENFDQITITPNPTNGVFTLRSQLNGRYKILDLEGNIIAFGEVEKSQVKTFELTTLPEGMYFIRVEGMEGVQIGKILKL